MKRFKACDVYSSVSIDGGDARPYYDESANVEISMDVLQTGLTSLKYS